MTGEEKGLLGSRYFAAHPTVPRATIVANVNTDMFLPLFPLKTLMVLGLDESDLGADIRAAAKAARRRVQADPEPQRNRFVRSDQYSFIQRRHSGAGDEGRLRGELARGRDRGASGPPSATTRRRTISSQPIDLSAAGKYVDVVRDLAVRIANRDRPAEVERRELLQAVRAGGEHALNSHSSDAQQFLLRNKNWCAKLFSWLSQPVH